MSIAIYNDDCFNILETLEDKTIDLFILDLPYGQTANKWDNIIDLDKMWIEIKRLLKDSGIVLFFATTKFGFEIIKSNTSWFRYDLIWEKSWAQGYLRAKKAPLRNHEMIYYFANPKFKEKDRTYNPQKTPGKPYTHPPGAFNPNYNKNGAATINKGDRYPCSIQKFKYDHPDKKFHPTQKPVLLLEWLIKSYTNENDTVCDFVMGSGNTGVASQNLNRNFIGVELNEDYFKHAKSELNID